MHELDKTLEAAREAYERWQDITFDQTPSAILTYIEALELALAATTSAGVTEEQVEAACMAYWTKWPAETAKSKTSLRDAMRRALEAARVAPVSQKEARPFAWTSLAGMKAIEEGREAFMFPASGDTSHLIPLYASPAPAGEPVGIKALELDWSGFSGITRNKAWAPDLQALVYTALNFMDGEGDADDDAAEQIIERLLDAICTGIKALEWDDIAGKRHVATTVVGIYTIVRYHSRFALVRPQDSFDGFGYAFEGPLAYCKAAAQADYEARIRSALHPTPTPAGIGRIQSSLHPSFSRSGIEPCGGCGQSDPSKRCLGCLHSFPFTPTPVSAPVGESVEVHIVFQDDGGAANLRFVEVETLDRKSVCAGTWLKRDDGYDVLALSVHPSDIKTVEAK